MTALVARTVASPVGPLTLVANAQALVELSFGDRPIRHEATHIGSNAHVDRAARELDEYFEKKRTRFDVPLDVGGTPFQRSVYRALLDVKFGETKSYADIAAAIGKGKAFRAVGGANNKNPIAIIVPCHRIIGASGSLTGYGGGLPTKEWLLAHERLA
ncbi:MAG: methylated-DNA--[protein]-cysteine S-methyltransferase [Polyangiaceae bacterium]